MIDYDLALWYERVANFMSKKEPLKNCPCDLDGICPYDAEYSGDCEYWCGADDE